jgi:hypothetical protein
MSNPSGELAGRERCAPQYGRREEWCPAEGRIPGRMTIIIVGSQQAYDFEYGLGSESWAMANPEGRPVWRALCKGVRLWA